MERKIHTNDKKKKDDKVKREKGTHQDEYFLLYLC